MYLLWRASVKNGDSFSLSFGTGSAMLGLLGTSIRGDACFFWVLDKCAITVSTTQTFICENPWNYWLTGREAFSRHTEISTKKGKFRADSGVLHGLNWQVGLVSHWGERDVGVAQDSLKYSWKSLNLFSYHFFLLRVFHFVSMVRNIKCV